MVLFRSTSPLFFYLLCWLNYSISNFSVDANSGSSVNVLMAYLCCIFVKVVGPSKVTKPAVIMTAVRGRVAVVYVLCHH